MSAAWAAGIAVGRYDIRREGPFMLTAGHETSTRNSQWTTDGVDREGSRSVPRRAWIIKSTWHSQQD